MTTTSDKTKGDLSSAEVVYEPMNEYGVVTEWAVALYFHSPTGDASDFIVRFLPCLSHEQAAQIADKYNALAAPYLIGQWANKPAKFVYSDIGKAEMWEGL